MAESDEEWARSQEHRKEHIMPGASNMHAHTQTLRQRHIPCAICKIDRNHDTNEEIRHI